MASYTREQLELWLKTTDVKASRVLDVGGSQLPVEGRTKSWDVKEYRILDLANPHECKQKPDIIMDLNLFSIWVKSQLSFKEKEIVGDGFDIAFCLEVFEYLWNPVQALKNINQFLKPNGVLYVSFHFIYPVHSPSTKDYLRYTPTGVEKMMELAGFEIVEMIGRKFTIDGFEAYSELINSEKMRMAGDFSKHNWAGCLVKARKTI